MDVPDYVLHFITDNCRRIRDGAEMANALVSELKALDGGH
jgi:hypothetical protein